jgi:hypothetical protein
MTHDPEIESYLRNRANKIEDELERMYVNEYIDLACDPSGPAPEGIVDRIPEYFMGCTPFMDKARRVAKVQASTDRLCQAWFDEPADYVHLDPSTPNQILVMLADSQREFIINVTDRTITKKD